MEKRGRRKSERAASAHIIRIKLRLYPDEDDDLIAFFATVPRGLCATMVKQALRSGTQKTDQDILFDDDELLDALDSFVE